MTTNIKQPKQATKQTQFATIELEVAIPTDLTHEQLQAELDESQLTATLKLKNDPVTIETEVLEVWEVKLHDEEMM